jgi:hypothetical protein
MGPRLILRVRTNRLGPIPRLQWVALLVGLSVGNLVAASFILAVQRNLPWEISLKYWKRKR